MPQVINTNISSLNSQRQLNRSQIGLQTAMERLSSGLRINSAKDDAAGLAIADRMTSQIRGLNQAVRNANDGISLSQVAEGALQETTNILQRMRELSVQSANDTNSGADRANLQKEVNQLISEIDRIATTTSFNGRNVLDGSLSSALFHIGANANQNINMSIGSTKVTDLGTHELLQTGDINQATNAATNLNGSTSLLIKGSLGSGTANFASGASAAAVASAVNTQTDKTGVTAQAITYAKLAGASADGAVAFDLQGSNSSPVTVSANITTTDYSELAQAINGVSGQTGITAQLGDDKASITLVHATGEDIKLTSAAGPTGLTIDGLKADGETASGGTAQPLATEAIITVGGNVSFYSPKGFTVESGDADISIVGASGSPDSSAMQSVSTIDVSTQLDSNKALNIIDGALSFISDVRADLGALQNRFSSTISNLENVSQNVSASRSRIQDADFAKESAELSRNQILQQAGTAMLAQANASTQNVLSLLQG